MTKLEKPIDTGVLSTRDVRERVLILTTRVRQSASELIARQNSYETPDQAKINFHVGRIATAQLFEALLRATPEEWDALVEGSSLNE